MKRWNRILAALLVAMMLCAVLGAGAEMELEPNSEQGLEDIELEIAPEEAPDALDDTLALPGDLAIGYLDLTSGDIEIPSAGDEQRRINDAYDDEDDEDYADDDEDDEDDGYDEDGFKIVDGVLVKYRGNSEDVVIPDGVTSIGEEAFYECISMESVTIPNGVTSIGNSAFYGCWNLSSLEIPKSVTSIGKYAFYDSSWYLEVTILAKNISIDDLAFDDWEYDDEYDEYIGPSFSIVCESKAIQWARDNVYDYEVFNHTRVVTDPAVAPTYAKTGLTEGSHCAACGEVIKEQKTVAVKELPANGVLLTKSKTKKVTLGDPSIKLLVAEGVGKSYKSSNSKVASVTDKGVVKFLKVGTAKITVTNEKGKKLVLTVNVVDGAALSSKKTSLEMGKTCVLTVKNLVKRKVTWTTSNKKVATVKNGTVKAVSVGKCTITAKIKNGKTLKCKVTVTDPAKLSEKSLSLLYADSAKLKLTGALKRQVTWSTSNDGVVKITKSTDSYANLKAVKAGTATITAKVKNGKTLKCKVTVTDPAKLSAESLKLSCVDSAKLKLTGGLDRQVTWSASDDTVVKISKSDNGSATIRGLKKGTATVTAKVKNGKTLKCKITVVNPLAIKEYYDDDLASWQVGVKFTNQSNKKIIYVTFDILQYNNRGDKLQSPYDYYYYNNDIDPHDYRFVDYTVNDDTRSVKFKITEVTFADKTTWKP